ncbi:hypothetical protein Caci_3055 [Catenulispora acidiphila DSM 44928]|uniref:Uncharacterized protein n=1 Tax=Catenulispora acidiphila (strain DSM 44928 / JCM 14897 / NBRC 102108 / NRRL B-24433 / ID139908) TaxID=479433 RepID=C7Q4J5_CATAD|nr:hypothetical protein [Catenulispora acidiphila]ACU71964.1 hypothetical protein Caci_3055 [Catenulispora acidiphila DSM 44928]
MSIDAAPSADIEMARVLHAALGMYLASNGLGPDLEPLLYSIEEAAERLGLESTNQLYRRTSDGTWPYTLIGGLKKFSKANLEQIIKIQAREAVSKASRDALRAA